MHSISVPALITLFIIALLLFGPRSIIGPPRGPL
jgi:Sec-independent protein translocase protein TatA